tara:strand:- start:1638 stop:2747 length:1110 start_codon:yes stop_codon:yes gene_type:complete
LLLVGWVSREQQAVILYLQAENATLREQLGPKRLCFTQRQRRRLVERDQALGRALLERYTTLVTPDTILRWYRRLVAQRYGTTQKAQRGRGRPRKRDDLVALVVKIARENPGFGYTRIRDTLHNLGHQLARSSVARILADQGVEPAPERSRRTSWNAFLSAHWESLAAADFFQVEALTWRGVVRYSVFFVMELKTRRVHVAGIRENPDSAWLLQVGRNLINACKGFLRGKTHLILDRDPLYSSAFKDLLDGAGVSVVTLPRRSPNLNAHAERFVRSVRSECLDHLVILGERHLRVVIRDYLAHYHAERNHQGLGSALIDPGPGVGRSEGEIACRSRLGGFLRYYHRRPPDRRLRPSALPCPPLAGFGHV